MKFQVGDKVKFLNSSGGGIISKVISPSLVNVMIEDGFEIPTLASELVKVEPKGKVEKMFDEVFGVSSASLPGPLSNLERGNRGQGGQGGEVETGNQAPVTDDRQSPLGNYSFIAKNTPGVYLAFVPHDQKWLVTGLVEICLVNHTTMDVLYAFFLEGEKKLSGKDYDLLFPGNRILIDTIDRDELLNWTRGIVQLIFFQESPEKIFLPVNAEFEISPKRFNDENNYKASQFMEDRLLLISLAQVAALSPVIAMADSRMDEEALLRQKALEVKPVSLIQKHQTSPREAVVDLHIGELMENFTHLTPHEILKFQMDYFEKCINSAAERNFHKVTFIHGVGNGTLKSAIIRRVREYEQYESHLASLEKFGVGAIDVTIKPLK